MCSIPLVNASFILLLKAVMVQPTVVYMTSCSGTALCQAPRMAHTATQTAAVPAHKLTTTGARKHQPALMQHNIRMRSTHVQLTATSTG